MKPSKKGRIDMTTAQHHQRMIRCCREAAHNLRRSLPHNIEVDDLAQEGFISVFKLSMTKPVEEMTDGFIRTKAKWGMLDYLRSLDVISKGRREKQKKASAVSSEFFSSHGRNPTIEELSSLLCLSTEEAYESTVPYTTQSLSDMSPQNSSDRGTVAWEELSVFEDISSDPALIQELKDTLVSFYESLPRSYKTVMDSMLEGDDPEVGASKSNLTLGSYYHAVILLKIRLAQQLGLVPTT